MDDDARFMQRAIEIARDRVGRTEDNPAVGCLIVADGAVVGEAATAVGGRPHAEEQALDQVGDRARGAVAYVTLEPCGERRSGAMSCSERLVAAGVGRVVIACEDPSPLASARGLKRIADAGIEVVTGVLAHKAAEILYQEYFARFSVAPRDAAP